MECLPSTHENSGFDTYYHLKPSVGASKFKVNLCARTTQTNNKIVVVVVVRWGDLLSIFKEK